MPNVGALCNREVMKQMIDELDASATAKVQKRLKKKAAKQPEGKGTKTDVAEAYSPARMTKVAERLGYKPGFALDLTNLDENGIVWDLSLKERQEKALELLETMAPWLLIVSPPCTMFSTLQGFNFKKQDEEQVRPRMEEAIEHIAFSVLLCIRQAEAGRKYMFEHPAGASSWQTKLVNKLFLYRDSDRVNFDFCQAGMKLRKTGEGIVKKRTGIMTNSIALQIRLRELQCQGHHKHVQISGAQARECQ